MHLRDERRHLIDVHDLAVRDDARAAEVALEEDASLRAILIVRLSHEDRR